EPRGDAAASDLPGEYSRGSFPRSYARAFGRNAAIRLGRRGALDLLQRSGRGLFDFMVREPPDNRDSDGGHDVRSNHGYDRRPGRRMATTAAALATKLAGIQNLDKLWRARLSRRGRRLYHPATRSINARRDGITRGH